VQKLVSIEGVGFPREHPMHGPASERTRRWIENIRDMEKRRAKSYPSPAAAMARMREVNPRLSDEVARHLTLHGTNWDSDGSLLWKFDNFARVFAPYGHNVEDSVEMLGQITCPTLFFWGLESFLPVEVAGAGHWVHHDALDLFLRVTEEFLK
jgi:pimeloyl-ACP methyl ester carboxylesterase